MSDVNSLMSNKTHEEIKEEYEHEIYELNAEKKYIECITKTEEYLDYLKKSEDEIKDYVMWKWNYFIGIKYNITNDNKSALKHANIALDYINYEEGTTNDDYIKTLWLFASSYRRNNDIKKAVEIYNNIADYYEKVNNTAYTLENKFMVAKLSIRLNHMVDIAKEYENNKGIIEKEIENKKNYNDILFQMYKEILDMTLKTEDKDKFLNIFDNIQCQVLKSKLKRNYLVVYDSIN